MADEERHGAGMGIKKMFGALAQKHMEKHGSSRRASEGSPNISDAAKAITERKKKLKEAAEE